jgi:hypothetical protein
MSDDWMTAGFSFGRISRSFNPYFTYHIKWWVSPGKRQQRYFCNSWIRLLACYRHVSPIFEPDLKSTVVKDSSPWSYWVLKDKLHSLLVPDQPADSGEQLLVGIQMGPATGKKVEFRKEVTRNRPRLKLRKFQTLINLLFKALFNPEFLKVHISLVGSRTTVHVFLRRGRRKHRWKQSEVIMPKISSGY